MNRKYLLVKVVDKGLEVLKKVHEGDKKAVLLSKNPDEQLWTVSSFKEGIAQIEKYNNRFKVKKTIVAHPRQVRNFVPDWDLSKLTEDEIEKIKSLHEKSKYVEIFKIHNSKELSPETYCCVGSHKSFVDHNMQRL